MKRFKDYLQEQNLLDEAGNISSTIAIRTHNDVLKYGRDALRIKLEDRKLDDKLNSITRAVVTSSSLDLMGVAVSGEQSFTSTIAKGMSIRKI
jgi:hypothetical protein